MPRYSLRARGPSGAELGPTATAGLDFKIIPGSAPEGVPPRRAGFNAPFGFESRYSGTGISNGVYFFIIPYYL